MSEGHQLPSNNRVRELFLADLKTDVEQINQALTGERGQVVWQRLLPILVHMSSCSKLVKETELINYIETLILFIRRCLAIEAAPLSACTLLIQEGLRPLSVFIKEGGGIWLLAANQWKEYISPCLQSATSLPYKDTSAAVKSEQEGVLALFAGELEAQVAELNSGLLRLEHQYGDLLTLQSLMRAAHSIKGAARVVSLPTIVRLAHLIEESFVAAQQREFFIGEFFFEILFEGADFLSNLGKINSQYIAAQVDVKNFTIHVLCAALEVCLQIPHVMPIKTGIENPLLSPEESSAVEVPLLTEEEEGTIFQPYSRMLRINAETLNRLIGLAGEALVESRWLPMFGTSLIKFKREYSALGQSVDQLRLSLQQERGSPIQSYQLDDLLQRVAACQRYLNDRLAEFEMFAHRYSNIAERLYRSVIESRMRPFADIIGPLPRMVRDLAKQLHKKVRLEIYGEMMPVDREILEKLEAPLAHLLRNAVDHGIEEPVQRLSVGKVEEGVITMRAQHLAGMLAIEVKDDGKGIDAELIKKNILGKQLASPEMVQNLSRQELYDFMFLPGFSTATKVTEISGRGVGLSAVQNFVNGVGGRIRIDSQMGHRFSVYILLPLTLSVIRALLVQVAGELYALPLAKIDRVLHIERSTVEHLEQRPYFLYAGENVGLVTANEILELGTAPSLGESIPLVIIGDQTNRYGVTVERFVGEKELVVHELDPLLGKVPNISAGAFAEDGSPILILDVDDLMHSIDALLSGGRLRSISASPESSPILPDKKSILVVDDSITVREVECRLLTNHGYAVDTAVNGMDGWNAVRSGHYDLVITDIDMPRMNGIDFIKAMRADVRFQELPIMIVTYKEREEDRLKGLEAGANYYLTKSSFHDETLVQAVRDLIGDPNTIAPDRENKK